MRAPFANREEAARLLIGSLQHLRGQNGVVLAVPRGAVPMAGIIARALGWPLDVVLIKKLGHPSNPEYAVGAVSEESFVLSPGAQISEAYLSEQLARLRAQLRARREAYFGQRAPLPLRGRPVVIVDDGVATGHTLSATIALVRKQQPARIIVAVPVSSPDALRRLQAVADEVVCLLAPPDFAAVGQYYQDFGEVSDAEAIAALHRAQPAGS